MDTLGTLKSPDDLEEIFMLKIKWSFCYFSDFSMPLSIKEANPHCRRSKVPMVWYHLSIATHTA